MVIEELEHSKHLNKCDMCKKNFDAYHLTVDHPYLPPDFIYDDAEITISFGKRGNEKNVTLNMCPECTEKLLEILDKHFPRLNLEDEL